MEHQRNQQSLENQESSFIQLRKKLTISNKKLASYFYSQFKNAGVKEKEDEYLKTKITNIDL